MDYASQPMMSMGVSDAPVVDQTLDMSPMDLFDSIFWGECSPFSFGSETDNFQINIR